MDALPQIREGQLGDLDRLVDTLSDSFSNDPLFNWVFPQPQLYPIFFRLLVKDLYLPRGIIHVEEKGRAAALWLPPEERYELPPRIGMLNFGFQLVIREGLRPFWRMQQQGSVYAKHLPKEPHYYLQFIGCRQSDQGHGIGAALIKEGTQVCDDHGMPAYLESSNKLNVPLYKRHGFEVKAEQQVSKNGPTAWFMWREPR
ncbi:MAG: GNAT superfamily N-acetyltransferase [Halioglobus sp.]|jgi:GNAT superfamily N-acetyltransferase